MTKKITLLAILVSAFQMNAQLFEDFEAGTFPPAGWNISDNLESIEMLWVTTIPAYQGMNSTYGAMANRYNVGAGTASEQWLVTPAVQVNGSNMLSFYARETLIGDQDTSLQIRVSSESQTNHSTFQTIATFTETDFTDLEFGLQSVSLADYAGQNVYIAFVRFYVQPTPNIGGDRWILDNINVGGILERDNFIVNSVSLYPNPATDVIRIDPKETITNVQIYNALGQKVKSAKVNEINVSDLSPGNYFMTIQSDSGIFSQKFTKR